MDWNGRDREIDPKVALRIRYCDLEELRQQNKTKCDTCGSIVPSSNAIEIWKGNSCLYVHCDACLSSAPFSMARYPNGIHITTDKNGTGLIRGSSSRLPSKSRPRGM